MRRLLICVALASSLARGQDVENAQETVESVVFFHRHGDRNAIDLMPNDAENNRSWKDPPGSLTQKGQAMLEHLGSSFRKRYLLGQPYKVAAPSYRRGEYWARATDYDRTIESALSFLQGFYPVGSSPESGLASGATVVPIRTLERSKDPVLLGYEGGTLCPRVAELVQESLNSEEWKEVERENEEFLETLTNISGYRPGAMSAAQVGMVSDTLFCERQHSMNWLPGFTEELYEKANALHEKGLRFRFASSAEYSRLAGGNMVGEVISRFQHAQDIVPCLPVPDLAYPLTGSPKISHFSAHDSTLVALLGALNSFDDILPSYGSSVVFELVRKEPAQAYFVRVFYNRGVESPFVDSNILELCGAGMTLCPFESFAEHVKPMIPDNYNSECKALKSQSETHASSQLGRYGTYFLLGSVSLMLMLCACSHMLKSATPEHAEYEVCKEPI